MEMTRKSNKTKRTPVKVSQGQTGAKASTSSPIQTDNKFAVLADIHVTNQPNQTTKTVLANQTQTITVEESATNKCAHKNQAPVCPRAALCTSTPVKQKRPQSASSTENEHSEGRMAGKKSKLSTGKLSKNNSANSTTDSMNSEEIHQIDYMENTMDEVTQKRLRTVYINGTEKTFAKLKYQEFDRINKKIRQYIQVEKIDKKGHSIRVVCTNTADRDRLLKVDSIDGWLVAVSLPFSVQPDRSAVETGFQTVSHRKYKYVIHKVPIDMDEKYIQEYLGDECENATRIFSRKTGEKIQRKQ